MKRVAKHDLSASNTRTRTYVLEKKIDLPIMTVLLFPPRESCKNDLCFETGPNANPTNKGICKPNTAHRSMNLALNTIRKFK
jgi:hypothetical protein